MVTACACKTIKCSSFNFAVVTFIGAQLKIEMASETELCVDFKGKVSHSMSVIHQLFV